VTPCRQHHAERGHDRCWESDNALYEACGLPPLPKELPTIEEHREACDAWRAAKYGVPPESESCGRLRRLEELLEDLEIDLKGLYNCLFVNPDETPEWMLRNIVRSMKAGVDEALCRVEKFRRQGAKPHV
jgi:hypothetical protein